MGVDDPVRRKINLVSGTSGGMRRLLEFVMLANGLLFLFGAVQHLGLSIGAFHEPHIIPAAIVETLCGLSLLSGGVVLVKRSPIEWGVAVTANLIALGGVIMGMIALAAGRGPRTASNDLYHRIMLILIATSLVILVFARSAVDRKRNGEGSAEMR